MGLGLRYVRSIDHPVAIGVADQEAHWDIHVGRTRRRSHPSDVHSESLSITNPRQRDRDRVPARVAAPAVPVPVPGLWHVTDAVPGR